MAKKFGKLLLFGTAVGVAAAGAYYLLKKSDADRFDDDDFEDEDEFEDDDEDYENGTESAERSYVPLNFDTKTDTAPAKASASADADAEPFDEEDLAPIDEVDAPESAPDGKAAVKSTQVAETIEEFFDEEDSDKVEE